MPQETALQAKKMANMREKLLHVLDHFEHILPAQAPIRDFVHHNTLHGFEHLSFPEALKSANKLTGAYGYWPQEKFREKYLQGRIDNADIMQALSSDASLESDAALFKAGERQFYRKDIYRLALLYPIKNISSCQLRWKADEVHAFETFHHDISQAMQDKLLKAAHSNGFDTESATLQALWLSCLDVLNLDAELLHPEEMMNLSHEQAGKMFNALSLESQQADLSSVSEAQKERQKAWQTLECLLQNSNKEDKKFNLTSLIKKLTGVDIEDDVIDRSKSKVEPLLHKASYDILDELLEQVGSKITLRTFLKKVTGIDIQQDIAVYLQPYLSNWMDQGFAAWNAEDRTKGFYQSWKSSALEDENWIFSGIPDWREHIESLPDDPVDTILAELGRMGISEENWVTYIERLALDLPGWSGMFYWRHSHPNYDGHATAVNMMDYLAVRLITEHLYARRLCRDLWLVEANLATLRGYFHYQHAEFLVRYTLNNEHLPEYLVGLSQQLVEHHSSHSDSSHEWRYLSHLIWTWQQTSEADGEQTYTLHHEGWKLFLIAQHLGLCSAELQSLKHDDVAAIFSCLESLGKEKSGFLLLQAYEHHYREEMFAVITQNQGRGTWKDRKHQRPEAQIIFCMDDREESVRRHLEHLNPNIETLGAAAFFGIVMNWKDLNDDGSVVLCPVVVVPEHEIAEVPEKGHEQSAEQHKKRYALRGKLRNFIHQETRRNLVGTAVLIALSVPLATMRLIGKVFLPLLWGNAEKKLTQSFDKEIITRITSTAKETLKDRSIKNNQQGFTLEEQTNIVEGFLQNNGLLTGFSHFVVTMGHFSHNLNNPHTAAYGCGACGGKYSGPNGRAFASMANNPQVREALAKRNLNIPDDCWFVGAEHDTCSEGVTWYDTDLIPETLQAEFVKLRADLKQATEQSAHERCRKLASAPRKPSLKSAVDHITGRGLDFSQARPELGHATIACGFVGRRYISQGTFLDRRSFLISYDPNTDPEGKFLERILLTAGPVGAGINLEYYFSAVNNDRYGCSSKVVHNLSGLFGVMEGTASDLRTGLPQQMVEIHEPMRLQLMVEATTEVLTAIYTRQPSIQQLVGSGWLLLSAKDPESEAIHTFDPVTGWTRWQSPDITIPTIEKSADWYQDHYDHLSPALIKRVTP